MSASLNTLVDCALTKTVIAKENTDKFVIGGLLKVGSTTVLLLPEGGDLRYYRLFSQLYIFFNGH